MADLRTRIAAVVAAHRDQCGDCSCGWESWEESWDMHLADAVIRELVELRRIDQVREVCVASLNLDRTAPGEVFCDRAWLADSILNILSGMTDE